MIYPTLLEIPVGDLRPIVDGHVLLNGAVVNLTGLVSCKFWMTEILADGSLDSTPTISGVAGTIANAATGNLTYTWAGSDTATAGRYASYFKGYWGASSTIPQTFRGPTIWIYVPGSKVTGS